MPDQPIQFLLDQLATNEQDRERFNLANPEIHIYQNYSTNYKIKFSFEGDKATNFKALAEYKQITIIRTCLSRVNGEAVLGVFEDKILLTSMTFGLVTNALYISFDYPLRNGKSIDEAIQALHEKMLELVPEYVELINNNK